MRTTRTSHNARRAITRTKRTYSAWGITLLIIGIVSGSLLTWMASEASHAHAVSEFEAVRDMVMSSIQSANEQLCVNMHVVGAGITNQFRVRDPLATAVDGTFICGPSLSTFLSLTQPVLDSHPFVSLMEWAPMVHTENQRHLWEEFMQNHTQRDMGFKNTTNPFGAGQLVPAAPNGQPYMPIVYVNPWNPDNGVLMLDLLSSWGFRAPLLNQSSVSHEFVSTPPFRLFDGHLGVIIDLVVTNSPNVSVIDQDGVCGSLIAIVRVSTMLQEIEGLSRLLPSSFSVWVRDVQTNTTLFHSNPSMSLSGRGTHDDLQDDQSTLFGGRVWNVHIEKVAETWNGFTILIILLPCMVGGVVLVLECMVAECCRRDIQNVRRFEETVYESAKKVHDQTNRYLRHEIRNPLHSCAGSLQEVKHGLQHFVGRVQDSLMASDPLWDVVDRMQLDIGNANEALGQITRVIKDMMRMSNDGDGKVNCDITPRVVENVMAMVRDLAHQYRSIILHNVELGLTIPGTMRPYILDVNRLRQVLGNGMHNAAKHTESGSILLHAEVVQHHATPWMVCTISNTVRAPLSNGQAQWNYTIQSQSLARLPDTVPFLRRHLQRFHHGRFLKRGVLVHDTRVPQTAVQEQIEYYLTSQASTNYGLPLCNKLVTSLGGAMGLEFLSRQAVCLFWVAIPMVNITQSSSVRHHTQAGAGAGAGAGTLSLRTSVAPNSDHPFRMLVVDDDPIILGVVERQLHRIGLDVVGAPSAALALQSAGTQEPNGILLDIVMMDKDGVDVCKELRAGGVQCPIFAMTSNCSQRDIHLYASSGFDGVLAKPFTNADLKEAVQAMQHPGSSDMIRAFHQLPRQQEKGEADNGIPSLTAADGCCVLVVEDHAISRDLMVRQCKRGGVDVVIEVSKGEDAVRIAEQCRNNLVGIFMDLHLGGAFDGNETSRRIRSFNESVPIIATTAAEEKVGRHFTSVLLKPIVESNVVEQCAEWVAAWKAKLAGDDAV